MKYIFVYFSYILFKIETKEDLCSREAPRWKWESNFLIMGKSFMMRLILQSLQSATENIKPSSRKMQTWNQPNKTFRNFPDKMQNNM